MVDVYGFAPGKVVEIPLAGKPARFTVAGVWRDYARPQGAVVIERERYVALTGDHERDAAPRCGSRPGTSAEERCAARWSPTFPAARGWTSPPRARSAQMSLHVFDRTFAVTYALELAAVVIGLCGLSSSFGALMLSRRREFGVLRHLGMTRRQIGAMLASRRAAAERHRAGLAGLGRGLCHQPDLGPGRQSPVVPLEHGDVDSLDDARRGGGGRARALDPHRARQRPQGARR